MAASVHQEVEFDVSPAKVYAALTDPAQHAAFSGAASQIDAAPGGAFVQHDGQILGRTLEAEPGASLVQAWRVAAWPQGVYSVVRYTFEATPTGSKVTLDHTGLPEGAADMIAQGWQMRYWAPMKAFFAG